MPPLADPPTAIMPLVQAPSQSLSRPQAGLLHGGADGVTYIGDSDQAQVLRPDADAASKFDGITRPGRSERDNDAAHVA